MREELHKLLQWAKTERRDAKRSDNAEEYSFASAYHDGVRDAVAIVDRHAENLAKQKERANDDE